MSAYIVTVDDDAQMRNMLMDALTREGYEVQQAPNAQEALELLDKRRPDLLVLDVGMPEVDGLTLCRQLREDDRFITLPILFLTAFSQPEDVVKGLDAGGDDYTSKPIEINVFLARVRSLLRRSAIAETVAEKAEDDEEDEPGAIITLGRLTLNSNTFQIEVDGEATQLTATEHRLLRYFMENPEQPLSPQRLLESVWDYPPYTGDPDLVRVHVRNLRAKLEEDTSSPEFIKTIHGVGYSLHG